MMSVSMRAGDGIGLPGFDGRTDAGSRSLYVPSGRSVWELGTSGKPRDKAQADFRKRSLDPDGIDPLTTTYVAVSLARFSDKDRWAARVRASNAWRNVLALDADDLHGWLELHPDIHIWISERLGLHPRDVSSVDTWWSAWARQTKPATPAALVLAGRSKQAAELANLLNDTARSIAVYAGSRDEAIAFLAATSIPSNVADHDDTVVPIIVTPLIVSDDREWSRLSSRRPRLVLVPDFEGADVTSAINNGHTVVLPMGPGDNPRRVDIELPRLAPEAARSALIDAGLAYDDADRGARHARRSLTSFRRLRAANAAVKKPDWARAPIAGELAPLVLVGSWSINATSDHRAIEKITGRAYADDERQLRALLGTADPPFTVSGNSWTLTAPVDAWDLLSSFLTTRDLDNWRRVATAVLQTNPDTTAIDAPSASGPAANNCSRSLRRGIIRGAALLAHDATTSGPDQEPWSEYADAFCHDLLANATTEQWASLSELLPVIAESSPDRFLDALASALDTGDGGLLRSFIDERKSTLHGFAPYAGLLWALETLAWSDQYVAQACYVLAQLAEIDPGGKLVNSPLTSLRQILLPWTANTNASHQTRLEIVAGILRRQPAVGWSLLLGLLPRLHDHSGVSVSPLFRDWSASVPEPAMADIVPFAEALIELALQHVAEASDGWPDLIGRLGDLPAASADLVLSALGSLDPDPFTAADRRLMWNALNTLCTTHRRHIASTWALAEPSLESIEAIVGRWEPEGSPEHFARLFDWRPDLPGIKRSDRHASDEAISHARAAALNKIMKSDAPTAALVALIAQSKVPALVGGAVAHADLDAAGAFLLTQIDAGGPIEVAAGAWIAAMCALAGPTWEQSLLARAASDPTAPASAKTGIYLSLSNRSATWSTVASESHEVQDEDLVEFVELLLERRRPWSVIDLLGFRIDAVTGPVVALAVRALTDAARDDASEPLAPGDCAYDVGVLLDACEQAGVSTDVLVDLEIAYFDLLEQSRPARQLYGHLGRHPASFVALVCDAYRPADGTAAQPDANPEAVARARRSYSTLRDWREVPGLRDDGTIDPVVLGAWLATARQLLSENDREDIGEEKIGELLAGSPDGSDGIWPAEPIRDLLETAPSRFLSQGLSIGRCNARGVTMRGAFDGGNQEHTLADHYEASSKATMARWPKTGHLLRDLSLIFRNWARRHDRQSDLFATGD